VSSQIFRDTLSKFYPKKDRTHNNARVHSFVQRDAEAGREEGRMKGRGRDGRRRRRRRKGDRGGHDEGGGARRGLLER